jgi:hypothetical protein
MRNRATPSSVAAAATTVTLWALFSHSSLAFVVLPSAAPHQVSRMIQPRMALYSAFPVALDPSPANQTNSDALPTSSSGVTDDATTTTATATTTKKERKANLDLNEQLNRYAESCANPKKPVVAQAAACEALWRLQVAQADTISFNTVLKAWARVCQTLAEHAQEEHGHMLDSNTPVYTARDAAERALALLQQQAALATSTTTDPVVHPDVASYNVVMDAWAKSRTPEAAEQVNHLLQALHASPTLQPDVFSYNALVDAHAYSFAPDRLEILHTIWNKMETLSQQEGTRDIRPTVRTINSILHAYSRRVQEVEDGAALAQDALDILHRMKETYRVSQNPSDQPDIMTYTTCMDALARVGTAEATEQAQRLFDEVTQLYQDTRNPRYMPSVYTYVTLMKAWSRSPSPEAVPRCQELLERMLQSKGVVPNNRAFTALLSAWGRSRDNSKATQALHLVQRMKRMAQEFPEVAPSLVTYNTAIDCCSRTRGDTRQQASAFQIAFAMFKAAAMDCTPNHVTFGTLLKAAAFLLPPGPERTSIAKAVFQRAIADGQVEISVIKNLQKCLDAQVMQELLSPLMDFNGNMDFSRIPNSWSKHVR